MNVATVMDQLGVRLATITGLRVFDFPPDSISPPAGVVSWPTDGQYDSTFKRGADEATFQIHILIGLVSDRSARDQLAAYISGDKSVKDAVEGGTVGMSARVESWDVSVMTLGGTAYLAATFDVNVIA